MIARLLYWLTRNRPCRLIKLPDGPYLERYYLGTWRGKYFYLHRFVRNDSERHLHDHPWRKAWSLVLAGGYTEQRGLLTGLGIHVRTEHVRRCNTLYRHHELHRPNRTDLHRIVRIRPETWTLFWHTEWEFEWGFYEITPPLPTVEFVRGAVPYRYRYTRYPSKEDPRWWLDAPRAHDAGREPFRR